MTQIINILGLLFNITGTIILAISFNKYLTSLHGAIALHDITIKGLVKQENKILESNLEILLMTGIKSAVFRTKIGFILITIGFILQLIPYIYSPYKLLAPIIQYL